MAKVMIYGILSILLALTAHYSTVHPVWSMNQLGLTHDRIEILIGLSMVLSIAWPVAAVFTLPERYRALPLALIVGYHAGHFDVYIEDAVNQVIKYQDTYTQANNGTTLTTI